MKNVIFIPALLLLMVFPMVGYSQVSSTSILKKESKKDKIWLVPRSFGKIPNAFSKPGQHPYLSTEEYNHPLPINSGPLLRVEPLTLNNKDVFLGYKRKNDWFLKDLNWEISEGDTSSWSSVLGLCMLVLVSPVESEY